MRSSRLAWTAAAALLYAGSPAKAQARAGTLCPDPAHPCAGFRANDLSFVLPRDGVARAEVRSDLYYAVILRSARPCAIPERDRAAAQALFPGQKVFSHRFECDDDVENNVTYTGVNRSAGFLAVYAGRNRQQASAMLARVARTGRFPGANLRRMQVVFVFP